MNDASSRAQDVDALLASCVTVDDFEAAARDRPPKMAYDYYRSGADEEQTLRRNRDVWSA